MNHMEPITRNKLFCDIQSVKEFQMSYWSQLMLIKMSVQQKRRMKCLLK